MWQACRCCIRLLSIPLSLGFFRFSPNYFLGFFHFSANYLFGLFLFFVSVHWKLVELSGLSGGCQPVRWRQAVWHSKGVDKSAIKREQSEVRINYVECEQTRPYGQDSKMVRMNALSWKGILHNLCHNRNFFKWWILQFKTSFISLKKNLQKN